MKKRLISIVLITCFLIAVVSFSSVQSSAYCSLNGHETDAVTRWSKLSSDGAHMGDRITTYRYESSATKPKYGSAIESGIGLWAGSLVCFEVASTSAEGVIKLTTGADYVGALTNRTISSNHVTSWEITLCIEEFDYIKDDPNSCTQAAVFAHELGHAFGLGHFDNSSQIMHTPAENTMTVTSEDRRGMNVMTHTHSHDVYYSTQLERWTSARHKVRCTSCFSYEPRNCDRTSYQSGGYIYYVYDCECGNQGTEMFPLY